MDIIGFIRGEPHCDRADVPGFAYPVPGDEFQQFALSFRRFPSGFVDGCFYGSRRNAVDPDFCNKLIANGY